ncbi:MAG: putative RNase H-like nuclease (RuvC/YqgF family) [Marinoscillum sp.]
MSDEMLHGILNMPPGIWDNSDIHKAQRHDAYKQASKRIENLERYNSGLANESCEQQRKIAALEKELSSVVAGLFSEHDLAIRDLENKIEGLGTAQEFACSDKRHQQYGGKLSTMQLTNIYYLKISDELAALKDQG